MMPSKTSRFQGIAKSSHPMHSKILFILLRIIWLWILLLDLMYEASFQINIEIVLFVSN